VAGKAATEKTGARGLMTVLEKTFREFKFELSSTSIKNFEVDTDTVEDPVNSLKNLLLQNQDALSEFLFKRVDEFREQFLEDHDIELEFSGDACEKIVEMAVKEDKSTKSICEHLFKDYEHGLQIVSRNTGRKRFTINAQAVENPDAELSKWVVDSFREKEKNEAEAPKLADETRESEEHA